MLGCAHRRHCLLPRLELAAIILSCAIVGQGCHWFRKPIELPNATRIDQDQLVIHCDFDLPQEHRLLQSLRAVRDGMQDKLGLATSGEAIHVYLFDDEARYRKYIQTNHPSFPNRRAFFLKDDATLSVYAHWGEQVAVDLRHEVAHGYLHAVASNVPLWLDEGIAEYFEVEPGKSGVNVPHLRMLMQRLDQGTWRPDMARLESLKSPAQMQQIDYAEAWLWTHWMLHSGPSRGWQLQGYLASLSRGTDLAPLAETEFGDRATRDELIAHLLSLVE